MTIIPVLRKEILLSGRWGDVAHGPSSSGPARLMSLASNLGSPSAKKPYDYQQRHSPTLETGLVETHLQHFMREKSLTIHLDLCLRFVISVILDRINQVICIICSLTPSPHISNGMYECISTQVVTYRTQKPICAGQIADTRQRHSTPEDLQRYLPVFLPWL